MSLGTTEARSVAGSTVTFDLNGQKINTAAAINWAPYRFKDGAWRAYPMHEYWDMFGVRLEQSLTNDPTLSAEDNATINHGKVILARAYYLSMNQGHAALVQIGQELALAYSPQQADLTLTNTIMTASFGIGGGVSAVLNKVLEQVGKQLLELLKTAKDKFQSLLYIINYSDPFMEDTWRLLFCKAITVAEMSKSEAVKQFIRG
ncbi:MAG: hypothetical protein KA765_19130, partial [Thermoflexales bacterium]|nr:hypothetical protein [Thermoflexales bacterium]